MTWIRYLGRGYWSTRVYLCRTGTSSSSDPCVGANRSLSADTYDDDDCDDVNRLTVGLGDLGLTIIFSGKTIPVQQVTHPGSEKG